MHLQKRVLLTAAWLTGALLPLLVEAQTVKKDILYKTTPESTLHLDLYYPEFERSGKYPVVIYTHGGGWAAGSKGGAASRTHMSKVVRSLTEKGFCVASVDYRLWEKGGTVSMRDCVIDSKDAIRYLSKNSDALSVDTDRVFTFGDSAGGQIAQILLLAAPDALPGTEELADFSYKMIAGVSWYGPCDFEKTELFNHDDRENFRDRFGPRILKPDSKPEEKLALYREMSPINYLKKNSPPLLMVQGDGDTTIPVMHAHYMQKGAAALEAPVETMIVKNAGHNWRKADGSTPIEPSVEEIYKRTVAFIAEHLSSPSILAQSAEETPLIISDGSRFETKDFYPKFSWEVTPQYFMFGDTQRVLLPEEVRSIAPRTGFICIEKSHGRKMLGAAELGAKHEAAAFKKIKPDMKVLFYFNSAYAWPFTSYNQVFTRDKIDQHPQLKKFLLIDPETGKLAHRRNTFFFDVLNPEFRRWWVDTVAGGVSESGCDGVFIDQMHGFSWLRKDKSQEVQRAMGDMMASLKKKMGPDKILLGNNANQAIAKHVFPAVDASMFEHYNEKLLSKESLLQDWKDMLRIAKAGKMSIFRIGVEVDRSPNQRQVPRGPRGARSDRMAALAKERLEYYLACYLIGAQPYSYFQYGWGWTLSSGSLQDYSELHNPLGAPKSAYQRANLDGWEFTREFEHAHVWIDTEKRQGKITWR